MYDFKRFIANEKHIPISVYNNIVPHYAPTSVLISKSLAELAAEDPKLGGALLSKEHT